MKFKIIVVPRFVGSAAVAFRRRRRGRATTSGGRARDFVSVIRVLFLGPLERAERGGDGPPADHREIPTIAEQLQTGARLWFH